MSNVDPPPLDPAVPPPKSFVLSYVTSARTSTRVRSVAAGVMLGLMVLQVLVGLALAAIALWEAYRRAFLWAWPGRFAGGLSEQIREFVGLLIWLPHFWIGLLAVAGGIAGIAASLRVRRGSRAASILSITLLLPMMLVVLLAAAAIFSVLFYEARHLGPAFTGLWIVVGLILTLAATLLVDVIAFLHWIAQNPATEMPRRPFV